MKILALDCASPACSVALINDGKTYHRYEWAPQNHTGLILPMLDDVLADSGLQAAELDAVAYGRGPGSFTGVRIAAGFAQGIALAHGLPMLAISTLASIAHRAYREAGISRALVAVDARMQEVYWGAWQVTGTGQAQLSGAEQVCPPDQVLVPDEGGWTGCGDGWQTYRGELDARAGGCLDAVHGEALYPHALDMAHLAVTEFAATGGQSPQDAQPVYLRDKVALTEKERAAKA
ncbi:tRNA (adenosine(37)-N6)-threonylcarbamoyltransferase complex dimerization subunit type 1 TsaB [Granulosicoccaceae sp. 1_MG-2023]|nr:tRNA (adenosine(37)-N6)-threonylcarbamoyltransferase complex dimerization subunit type 1 TsaB [Granulosicoccaceae sp. 1_MG-2023]